jgi:hypothetical protein
MKRQSKRSQRSIRGSIMVLVVAVLGLLAVIGTVYIVSSRASRNTAAATSVNANLDLARSAVMSQVQQTIGAAMLDASGAPGGYVKTGSYGTLAARNFDYPEPDATPAAPGSNSYSPNMRDEPWLAMNLYNSGGNDMSLLSPANFDPANGLYDFPPSTTYSYNSAFPASTTVVGDYFVGTASAYDAGSPTADGYICLLPFSEASGIRYRYGLRILDTNRMANLNTGAPGGEAGEADNFADTTGTYLTSYALAGNFTTSQQQNFFCGTASGMLGTTDKAITLLDPTTTGISRTGRLGTTLLTMPVFPGSFNAPAWQSTILSIEKASSPTGDFGFFDLTDELELRSYGNRGTLYQPRAASGTTGGGTETWPNTLGAYIADTAKPLGNSRRGNYTTYSFSRELRPYPDPDVNRQYLLTPVADGTNGNTALPSGMTATTIWPTAPARVAASTMISVSQSDDAMFYMARDATNIATAMENEGYNASSPPPHGSFGNVVDMFTHDEALAFAANYMTARWAGFRQDPAIVSVPAYYLPNGPSFIDSTGICVRTADASGNPLGRDFSGGTLPLASTGSTVYLGYAAQPFINEVAAFEAKDSMTNLTVVSDSAIELYNPYPIALSLNGFFLKVGSGLVIDLSKDTANIPQFIPANGYYVITGGGGHYSTLAALTASSSASGGYQVTNNAQAMLPSAGGAVVLYRAYRSRSAALSGIPTSEAPVDQASVASVSILVDPTALGTTATEYDVFRANGGSPAWGATVDSFSAQTPGQTLGMTNGGAANSPPLGDRYAANPSGQPAAPFGMGEFLGIIRLCNEIDNSAVPNTPAAINGLISDHIKQLAANAALPPYSTMGAMDKLDAQVRFDFYSDPSFFATSPPSDPSGKYDIRAMRLLDQLAMIDRVSNYSIDIGGGATDINKIRIPGRINVNTASGDVLRAIPNMTDQMVANILSYRSRPSPAVPYNGVTGTDYTNAGTYPGVGIRTLGELTVPLATVGAASIDVRDAAWGKIYNLCSVNSDTFVVYGFMEAVKRNPNYTGPFLNKAEWYTADTDAAFTATSTIDDPHNASPIVRVARRRWVAIVDRSFSNYKAGTANFSLPRIVAIKDLPQ